MRRAALVSLLLAGFVVCACAGPSAPLSAPSTAERDHAWADVQALVGDATCRADDQCHVVGVGARACGGPSRYIAWSSRVTDGDKLAAAAQHQRDLERASQRAEGRMSDCRVMAVPVAQCRPVSGAVAGAMAGVGRCVIAPDVPNSPASGRRIE